ncbi:MAG: SIR2 family protein [Anaerolineae bacterium]|nr:SIR2 family protein [Anaerolineae bacterium]
MLFAQFRSRTDYISSPEALNEALGDSFVILCGSAISGVQQPHVPMVTQVENAVLEIIASQLKLGTRTEQLVAEYAIALTTGQHKRLLQRTKFEAFLWRLQRAIGKDQVDDLLYRIYTCTGDEYGPNHAAIAYLLKQRKCLFCLTTNFDNAIELSYIGSGLLVHDQNYEPDQSLTKADSPLLLKLHGDAISKTCVATSPELSDAKVTGNYSYLEEFLKGQKVLVVGYSGVGDVDIAPHLSNLDAQLFWCNHSLDAFPNIHPKQVNVLCNLAARSGDLSELGKSQNLLLELAQVHGWQDTWEGSGHEWKGEVQDWVRQIDNRDLTKFIISVLSWETSWTHVHIAFFRQMEEEDTETTQFDVALSFAQVAAYRSAKKAFTRLLERPNLNAQLERDARELLGFIQWREGNFREGLETLDPLLPHPHNLDPDEVPKFAGQARIYLEIVGEMMLYETQLERRRRIYADTRADEAVQILKLAHTKAEDNYLARVALFDMEQATGMVIALDDVQELFNECYAMEEWASTALTSQLLLRISFWDGLQAIYRVTPRLFQRRSLKLILKGFAMVIFCALGQKFPLILKLLNGRILMGFFTAYLELAYTRKRRQWERDWAKSLLRVEGYTT